MSELQDELEEINGIGKEKSKEILAIMADHDVIEYPTYVEKALDAADDGDDRAAGMYLRRYLKD